MKVWRCCSHPQAEVKRVSTLRRRPEKTASV
jgi:hypothetical protein